MNRNRKTVSKLARTSARGVLREGGKIAKGVGKEGAKIVGGTIRGFLNAVNPFR